jgi:hypothetical protein
MHMKEVTCSRTSWSWDGCWPGVNRGQCGGCARRQALQTSTGVRQCWGSRALNAAASAACGQRQQQQQQQARCGCPAAAGRASHRLLLQRRHEHRHHHVPQLLLQRRHEHRHHHVPQLLVAKALERGCGLLRTEAPLQRGAGGPDEAEARQVVLLLAVPGGEGGRGRGRAVVRGRGRVVVRGRGRMVVRGRGYEINLCHSPDEACHAVLVLAVPGG